PSAAGASRASAAARWGTRPCCWARAARGSTAASTPPSASWCARRWAVPWRPRRRWSPCTSTTADGWRRCWASCAPPSTSAPRPSPRVRSSTTSSSDDGAAPLPRRPPGHPGRSLGALHQPAGGPARYRGLGRRAAVRAGTVRAEAAGGPAHVRLAGREDRRPARALLQGLRVRVRPPGQAGRGSIGFIFAFQVLPTIIFVAALFAILYYIGIMQVIVTLVARVMTRLMGASGAESLNAAAGIFMGQTEAPLTIRPYLNEMTQSELLCVMTSGMAHISAGIMGAYVLVAGVELRFLLASVLMTAPGSILMAKLLLPETEAPKTAGEVRLEIRRTDANLVGA